MTLPPPGDARPPVAGVHRWLLGTVTLALAIGVVVMHSLGVGHRGPAFDHRGAASAEHDSARAHHEPAIAQHAVAHRNGTSMPGTAVHDGHSAGHGAAVQDLDPAASPEHVVAAAVGDGPVVAVPEVGRGSMAVCLAVLPLLLLLRRLGDRAWFARAQSSARRHRHGLQASWLSLPPGRASPSLSELCILRT